MSKVRPSETAFTSAPIEKVPIGVIISVPAEKLISPWEFTDISIGTNGGLYPTFWSTLIGPGDEPHPATKDSATQTPSAAQRRAWSRGGCPPPRARSAIIRLSTDWVSTLISLVYLPHRRMPDVFIAHRH